GGRVERDDELDEGRLRRGRAPGRGEPERHGERCRQEDEKTPAQAENRTGDRRYTVPPRGCGGIGRRARFRSVWAKARGGSSPLIRIASPVCADRDGELPRPLGERGEY